ncbi:MAG: 3-hydroxyacyl-CoA dehydrogenase NAD-binding domain-containing protein [Planctomycetota bacterium]|nr:3-hydroxyacyl-CoA dehydrogenase NAD-binding domain-containing protein [Planctomycetota bacterium]
MEHDSPEFGSDPLEGVPLPPNAPEPGATVRYEHPEPGLVRLTLDPPHRSMPVFDVPLLCDLSAAVDRVAAEGSVRGLVICGREPLTFAAGADLDAIAELDTPETIARYIAFGQNLFQRIHRLSKGGGGKLMVVAAVGGPVPGGACELSLACDRIVLVDHKKSRIGLPEVKLGIVPGWGGCARLPRRIGVPAALDIILNGKLVVAQKALKIGMVDRLTHPEYLQRVAADIAMGRERCKRKGRGRNAWLVDRNPIAAALIQRTAAKGVHKATGGHYPAPRVALELVIDAPRESLEGALASERRVNSTLAQSPITKALIGIYHMSEAAKKLAVGPDGEKVASISRGAVIGAGVMGGAVASLMAERGIETRLRDLSRDALDETVRSHEAELAKQRSRRRLSSSEANAAIDRLEVTTKAVGFGRCELVVEAVAEVLEVKHAVFRELAELMPADAILATNTSSLSVTEIAAGVPNPERVVGMHFFNPVRRMPLVEIVRGRHTSDEVVARVARLALDLGKTPVVVEDVPGFLVNRLLAPYLDEAVCLLEEGATPERVDRAMKAFGMPMGPFELLDEVGLDIAGHAGASMERGYGERMTANAFLAPLVANGDLGKKTGNGIYRYERKRGGRPRSIGLNPRLPAASSTRAIAMTVPEITDRLILAMVNEGARAMSEGVMRSPRELDLATIFGMGFAPFRGGLLSYADDRGAAAIVARLAELASSPGVAERPGGAARFEPAARLVDLAETGGTFHEPR